MLPCLAQVTLNAWHVAILIVFSVGALIIALYCLFFMVPVKRFWERIGSLGGGLKGMEAHVKGVHDEVSKRLDSLEREAGERHEAISQESSEAAEKLARSDRELHRSLRQLRGDVESLQEELTRTRDHNAKLARSVEALTGQLQQLHSDFDLRGVELRESVRQQVADSFTTVESTILSALDAVQSEMLQSVGLPVTPPKSFSSRRPHPTPARNGDAFSTSARSNIISVGSLFSDTAGNRSEAEPEPEPDGEAESEEEGALDE
jgi:hypothetical protein